jgi:uncharacterized protein YvpB
MLKYVCIYKFDIMRKLKDFPYHSQRNNVYIPSGSCNVTSIAMCLNYHGINPIPSKQLEDELYDYMIKNKKSRHSGTHLAWAAETFPVFVGSNIKITDNYTEKGTLADIKAAIVAGNPCVVHGYFTRGGHIVAISGYDEVGVYIEDPWGEWYASGYDNSPEKGRYRLSWATFSRLVSPESPFNPGHIFLHVISAETVETVKNTAKKGNKNAA